ncbi:hypothetical protein HK097_011179 [Rhizophlyctis rosea]|uniref:Uncharacterized protein n=1 Tax=Rhizophlyctis rosea TaxID=64517 RepID=A0AAD5SMV8_9FUNG|nr:hypothetical protein HK097_011179 [Rhizophlyctis rosea]
MEKIEEEVQRKNVSLRRRGPPRQSKMSGAPRTRKLEEIDEDVRMRNSKKQTAKGGKGRSGLARGGGGMQARSSGGG